MRGPIHGAAIIGRWLETVGSFRGSVGVGGYDLLFVVAPEWSAERATSSGGSPFVAIHRPNDTAQETIVRALTYGAMATEFDTENHPVLQVVENTRQISWLGGRDSNPDNVVQSHVSYR